MGQVGPSFLKGTVGCNRESIMGVREDELIGGRDQYGACTVVLTSNPSTQEVRQEGQVTLCYLRGWREAWDT